MPRTIHICYCKNKCGVVDLAVGPFYKIWREGCLSKNAGTIQHQRDNPELAGAEIACASRFLAAEIYACRLSSRLFLCFSLDVSRGLTIEFEISDIVYFVIR
jgi:hypothetical protein